MQGDDSASGDFSPSIALNLARFPHNFAASYGFQRIQPDASTLSTIQTNAMRLFYGYSMDQHTFGVDLSAYDRQVTVGQFNDSYRLAVTWTYNFDKPTRSSARPIRSSLAGDSPIPHDLNLLLDVSLGGDFDSSSRRLQRSGMSNGVQLGPVNVFEQRLITDLTQRQRVVVVQDAGQVTKTGLVINMPDSVGPQEVAQVYEIVRKHMLDSFGSPSLTLEEGAIGPSFAADLNAGRLLRMMEWETESGKLRLGIPRRLDGQVRIEIQHAKYLGASRDTLWSLEAVR
jgi:hypothetical protein